MPERPSDDSSVNHKAPERPTNGTGTVRLDDVSTPARFDDVTQLEAAAQRGAWPAANQHLGHAYPSQSTGAPSNAHAPVSPEALLPLVQLEISRERGARSGNSFVPWKLVTFATFMTALLLGSVFFLRSMQSAAREVSGEPGSAHAGEPTGLIGRMTKRMLAAILPPSDLGAPEKVKVTQASATAPVAPKPLPPPLEFKPVEKKDNASRPAGFGSVEVRTIPDDAEVYLNGLLLGARSPVIATRQSTQDVYSFSVKHRGYLDHTAIFTLEPNERKVFTVELKRAKKGR